MGKEQSGPPYAEVRRQDRAITDQQWIKAFLHRAPVGVLATVHEGQPFLNSNLFVYDEAEHCIYMHTANVGRTQANIAREERVCFTIFEMGRLLPAATALEFSVEYSGVVIFGRAQLVDNPALAEVGLQLLLDKYAPQLRPGRDYQGITAAELRRTAVYCIRIDEWSGKQKAAPADFPGAFFYQPTADA